MAITQNGHLDTDDNDKPVMGGVSSVDNATIVNSAFDPTTRRLLVDATGGGSGVNFLTPTGTVNGVNAVFVFSSAPSIVFVDSVPKQKTQSPPDSTVNWTGTTTITLLVAPNFDIFGLG